MVGPCAHPSLQGGVVGVMQGAESPAQPAAPALHCGVWMEPLRTAAGINSVELLQEQHLPGPKPSWLPEPGESRKISCYGAPE